MSLAIRHLVLTASFAGVERHVCGLANEQVDRGHAVEVWGGEPTEMRHHLDPRIVQRPGKSLTRTILLGLARPAPDVVHAHMTRAELGAVAVGMIKKTPVVATRHFAAQRGRSRVGGIVRGPVAVRVARQISISHYVASHVDGPSTVIYPGVGQPIAGINGPRRPRVLVVQRLQPEKSTDVALRAFARGAPHGWGLDVVGSGPEEVSLRRLADDLGISHRTRFLGFRTDVPELMARASVLIAPCTIEGLGLSVLEAMAHGLPVVAADSGAHPETVGLADEAQLFEPGDDEQAGRALSRLCADRGLRDRYGAQLRQIQQSLFTPERQARLTDRVYEEVLG